MTAPKGYAKESVLACVKALGAPTPRTNAASRLVLSTENGVLVHASFARALERELYAAEATLASERSDHLRELATERAKVRVLRSACESICEEWGKNHDAPFYAGSSMEKRATAALAATEDAK